MRLTLRNVVLGSGILVIMLFLATFVFAWTGPSQSPPNGNVSAPINVGTTDQVKDAGLSVDALVVFGNTLFSGSDRYVNWGTTAGSGGYGLRDSSGTMQYKNSGGSWTSFSSASPWTTSGNDIYNSNSGNVGIGLTSPSQKLAVSGTVLATAFLYSSDARLKEDIVALASGLSSVMQLNPVSYIWKDGPQKGKEDIGFIAQEIETVVPEAVVTDSNGMKSVDYPRLVPVLVGAIQSQQQEIDALERRIEALERGE